MRLRNLLYRLPYWQRRLERGWFAGFSGDYVNIAMNREGWITNLTGDGTYCVRVPRSVAPASIIRQAERVIHDG